MSHVSAVDDGIVYPDSDGQPMAENETQFEQIVRLVHQLKIRFRDRDDVHIGADLLWYPVEGRPDISRAPDVFVVPGRPQLPPRPSWLQWQEDDVPMRHVIEILSPKNTATEMMDKRRFYDRHGVEEYLVFDPDTGSLDVHVRTDLGLVPVNVELPWTSAVLEGCRYRVDTGIPGDPDAFDLVLCDPDGTPVDRLDDLLARNAELEARLRAAGIEP